MPGPSCWECSALPARGWVMERLGFPGRKADISILTGFDK